MILTIIGIGVLGVSATLILKEVRPSFAVFVSLSTCIVISIIIVTQLQDIFISIDGFLSKLSLNSDVFITALKVVGVGYLIEFASDIAEESGLLSISHKIAFAGKVIIASICLPYLFEVFDMVLGLV